MALARSVVGKSMCLQVKACNESKCPNGQVELGSLISGGITRVSLETVPG